MQNIPKKLRKYLFVLIDSDSCVRCKVDLILHLHSVTCSLLCGHCRECDVINQADEDDTLYRVATPSVSKGGKGQDFILLASRRKPCDARCCNILHNKHLEMTLLMSFHILFLDFLFHLILCYIILHYIASLPPACSFIKSHDAILFCPCQGPISDCSALCHFAHSPSH